MIKRVVGVADDGRYLLWGDNALESSDSRSFGPVAPRSILGKVVYKADGSPLPPAPAGRE